MFLSQVIKGPIKRPPCVLIHGIDGVGKTTFAADAPNPIFLGAERGTDQLNVARFPVPRNWEEVLAMVKELALSDMHDYQTLAIDSMDWLEQILFKSICEEYRQPTIELAGGGFGKGYVVALTRWQILRDMIEELREKRKMTLCLIAHSEVVTFTDPQTQTAYQRYELKLHRRAAAMWREYVDAVLFANFQIFQKSDGNRVQSFGDGARILQTDRRPGWDAKNRYGLPLKIDLSWQALMDGIESGQPESPDVLRSNIEGLISLVPDPAVIPKIKETVLKAGDNVRTLAAIVNRLNVLTQPKEDQAC